MTASPDPTRLAALLADAFAREGVDPSYAAFVARHLCVPDDDWRWCCGSNCDPCVERLGRLVDEARRRLPGDGRDHP